ncbi:MAG: serine protease [Sandaracinaceae bacterium]
MIVAAIALFAPRALAQDEAVELRDVDRATVRLIALTGVEGARDEHGMWHLGLDVAHGSGVYVHADGWIATAAHVVAHADYLVVVPPGADRGYPAEVVYVGADHDVALVRAPVRATAVIPIQRRGRLAMGQTVNASGYPLDPRERWPAAVSGQVGRPLNDGRIQLSMSVNPGNSGGPVITESGQLVGVVSQGANLERGAQGFAIMEPIAPLAERLDAELRTARDAVANATDGADILLEQLEARAMPELQVRVDRVVNGTASTAPCAALFAVEAVSIEHRILSDAGVSRPHELHEDALVRYNLVREQAQRWATLGGREARDAYAALAAVSADAARANVITPTAPAANQQVAGPAVGPSPTAPTTELTIHDPPFFTFGFAARAALVVDDAQGADAIGGGLFGGIAVMRMSLGYGPYFRPAMELGISFDGGSWRDRGVFAVNSILGARFAIGPRSSAVILRGAWAPGYAEAEGRGGDATALAYDVGLGMSFDWLEVSLSWREVHRGAYAPLRAAFLNVGMELIP